VIRPGEEWTRPAAGPPDFDVAGDDAELAAAVAARPGALVRFRPTPTSDVARAVGLAADAPEDSAGDREAPMDALAIEGNGVAANIVVVGTPPDALRRFARRFAVTVRVDERAPWTGDATTVVVATGEFLRGLDVVPRGHPGDGRAETQIYAVAGRDLRALRGRLRTGTHVPHPAITQTVGRRIEITCGRALPLEIDGHRADPADHVVVSVVPHAYRLLL
jgi:hypothetical protein